MGFTDVHDLTDEPVGSTEKIDSNESVLQLKMVRDWLEWSPQLRELILSGMIKALSDEVTVESSWKNYASERNVRFNEMEYHLPREARLAGAARGTHRAGNTAPRGVFPHRGALRQGRRYLAQPVLPARYAARSQCTVSSRRITSRTSRPSSPSSANTTAARTGVSSIRCSAEDFRKLYPRWDDFAASAQGNWIRRDDSSIPIWPACLAEAVPGGKRMKRRTLILGGVAGALGLGALLRPRDVGQDHCAVFSRAQRRAG